LTSLNQETQIRMSGNKQRYSPDAREPCPGTVTATFSGIFASFPLGCTLIFVTSHPERANLLPRILLDAYSLTAAASAAISFFTALIGAKAAHQFNAAIAIPAITTPSVATSGMVLYNGRTG
jgi:hypothetical protein